MMFIEAFFRRYVTAGQQGGSIDRTRTPDDVGRQLLSVLLGICVLARTDPRREVLEGAANAALALLGHQQVAPGDRLRPVRRSRRNGRHVPRHGF